MQNKFTLLLICILLISATHGGFKSENKEITKSYMHVPAKDAGHKGFYISSIEITNKQYRDFLNDLKARGETAKLRRAMVDSAKWSVILKNDPYVKFYFQSPAYDNYPVVNVSQDGAFLYCEWLTEKYNTKAKVKVHFVLPNEEQWMRAAQAGDTSAIYPWKGNAVTLITSGKNKVNLCNYKHQQQPGAPVTDNKTADITAPSVSYVPNAYGIYNMSGNVAEMILGAGYTKGGSWMSAPEKVTIQSREEYAALPGSRPNIGFRPVMLTPDGE